MIKAQLTPRRRLRARVAGDYISGDIRLQTKTVIPTIDRLYIKPGEGYGGFSSVIVEAIPYAQRVSFNATPEIPDIIYGIEYSWFSKVVSRIQIMAGTGKSMSPQDILFVLERIKCYPQGYVESVFTHDLRYSSNITGRLPIVKKGTASSDLVRFTDIYTSANAIALEE